MGLFDKLFGKSETDSTLPKDIPPAPGTEVTTTNLAPYAGLSGIRFGRYSDNNKSYEQTQQWRIGEDLFKDKKYPESFAAFFSYISNKEEQNVVFKQDGDQFRFELIQGSKKVTGMCDGKTIVAEVPVVQMDSPGTAVMRRLLDINYSLYYSRCAMKDNNELCMLLDIPVQMASPSKLYYALREMAIKSDRLDDQLLADFKLLKPANDSHIEPVPDHETDVKYKYYKQWIDEHLKRAAWLNQDSFSGAIAYLLLTLLYRIEFLLVPEGNLLIELERISSLYWSKKDEIALIERNKMMVDAMEKLPAITREAFADSNYRTTATFAVASPAPADKFRENINSANRDAGWYVENKYPDIALIIVEYGLVYNLYAYSLPVIIRDLTTVFMAVVQASFFKDLGMQQAFYNPDTKEFNRTLIEEAVNKALHFLPDKYVDTRWDHSKIRYDTLYEFAVSFSSQVGNLHLELKK